jgi:hypothetical protein
MLASGVKMLRQSAAVKDESAWSMELACWPDGSV